MLLVLLLSSLFVSLSLLLLLSGLFKLFVLFISSLFNFSFLYLPFIFETIIYLIYLESISDFGINIKYFLQIFNFIFSTILLVITIIFLSYKNGKSSVVQNNKDLFLN